MRPGFWSNVSEIKEELKKFDAIHIEMVELCGFGACAPVKGATPPHGKKIKDGRTSKERLSYTIQP